jgi:hypothetical protein
VLIELDATEIGADRHKVAQQLAQTRLDVAACAPFSAFPAASCSTIRPPAPIP